MVDVRNLHVQFQGTPVLRGVSMSIPRGEVVALIGPNGSGKTTLLRCLLGLQRFDEGAITIMGERIGRKALSRIGYVPQRLTLERSFMLSVREFLSLRLRSTRHWFWKSKRATDLEIHGALQEIGVGGLLERPIAQLSGGQLQRVLIAFSLLEKR